MFEIRRREVTKQKKRENVRKMFVGKFSPNHQVITKLDRKVLLDDILLLCKQNWDKIFFRSLLGDLEKNFFQVLWEHIWVLCCTCVCDLIQVIYNS